MARTKASVGAKVSSGKSSKARCSAAPPPSSISGGSGSSDRSSRNSGGNPVCPRETPKWQRPITNFFISKEPSREEDEEEAGASTSRAKPKRNVIESDDEEVIDETRKSEEAINEEPPKNQVLDETIELQPLNGEDSHKIEEYYPKGKGKGKKTNKENVDTNVEKENVDTNVERTSLKRDLDDKNSEQVSKKIKVD